MELFTKNMVIVGIVVCIIGMLIKPLFKHNDTLRKWLLPLVLILISVGFMITIEILDSGGIAIKWGTTILNGILSGICCQFLYDKYRDILKRSKS